LFAVEAILIYEKYAWVVLRDISWSFGETGKYVDNSKPISLTGSNL
jgi:hypothetical protein